MPSIGSHTSSLTPAAQSLNDLLVVAEFLGKASSQPTKESDKMQEDVVVTIFSNLQDQGLFLQEAAKNRDLHRIFEEKTSTDSIQQSYKNLQKLFREIPEEKIEEALGELHGKNLCRNIKNTDEAKTHLLMCKYRLNSILLWLADRKSTPSLDQFQISWVLKELPVQSTAKKIERTMAEASQQQALAKPKKSQKT